LMGQLIRFVSSHEVGHTLGLTHNWGASSQTPVDSLRSRHYLNIHGHTSSIMDYARFNYVAQPEDNIPEYDLFPRIGEYDKWAIQWGYGFSNGGNPTEDKKIMSKLISDSLNKNPRLWYGAQGSPDPRVQNEDLGDDAAKASTYGIRNLKRILVNLPKWEHEEDGEYQDLQLTYKMLKDQFFMYMNQVLRNIGGEYTTLRGEDQDSSILIAGQKQVYAPVPVATQKEALAFFDRELFTTPLWILDKNITQKVAAATQPDFVEDLQVRVLNSLLSIQKINALLANMRKYGEQGYKVDEYISDIHKIIWKELATGKAIEPYRRNLQKSYVGALSDIITSNKQDVTETDAHSILRADLIRLQAEIHSALSKEKDNLSKYHLQDLEAQIRNVLEAKRSMQ
jgi:Met-zincin